VPADNADADGLDLLDLVPGQQQHQVQVVDHHVQHDADVGGPERKRADAMRLDELRRYGVLGDGEEGGVEPLGVSDLHAGGGGFGEFNQFPAGCGVVGERLFDEHRLAGPHERLGGGYVLNRRRGYDCRIDQVDRLGRTRQGLAFALSGYGPGSRLVDVHYADQLGLVHLAQYAGMDPAHPAGTDYGDLQPHDIDSLTAVFNSGGR